MESTSPQVVVCLSLLGPGPDNLGSREGFFLKDPWLVLGDFHSDVSNQNMFVYEFRTSHMNFIKNEHLKLYETCKYTQGRSEANLSNVTDVLRCLTSKYHES